jgi:hypothetical protein
MTPEQKFAQFLSDNPITSQEKLAQSLESLSVDELEQILRSELEVEKKAFAVTEKGHAFDAERAKLRGEAGAKEMELSQRHHAMGSATRKGNVLNALRFGTMSHEPRHEEYVEKKHRAGKNAYNPFGGLLTPSKHEKGGTRFLYGEHETGHNFETKDHRPQAKVSKHASVQSDVHEVHHRFNAPHHKNEARGQERGRQVGAIGGSAVGGAMAGVSTRDVINHLEHYATEDSPAHRIGQRLSKLPKKVKAPLIAGAALAGASAGGLFGRGAGGVAGRTVGVMKGPGKEKKSEVDDLSFEEKIVLADQWGREIAHELFEKTAAPNLSTVTNFAKHMGHSAAAGVAGQGIARNAANGAITGGALGAAKGAIAPGRDANGNRQGRLAGMARGAIGGAAVGGALQAGARAALPHVGSMNNAVGGAVRTAVGKGVQQTGQMLPQMARQTAVMPQGFAERAMQAVQKDVQGIHSNANQMHQKMVSNVKATRAANPGTGVGAKPAPTVPSQG